MLRQDLVQKAGPFIAGLLEPGQDSVQTAVELLGSSMQAVKELSAEPELVPRNGIDKPWLASFTLTGEWATGQRFFTFQRAR